VTWALPAVGRVDLDSAQKGSYDLGLPLPGPAGRRVWLKPDATRGGRFQVDPDGFPPNIGCRAGLGRESVR